MNILLIPTTDWLKHPTPHRHHYLVREMTERHNVFVLNFDIFQNREGLEKGGEVLVKAGGIAIEDLSVYYILNSPAHWSSIRNAIARHDIDVVFGANLLPSLMGFRAVRSARKRGKRIAGIYDLSDFFSESASIYYPDSFLGKHVVEPASQLLFLKNLESSDHINAVSTPLEAYARGLGYMNTSKVTNGVDTRIFKPGMGGDRIREELGLGDAPVLGFVGSLERWLDMETTLRGFKRLLQRVPEARYLIVGGSIKTDYRSRLEKLAKELGITGSVVFTGYVPYRSVPEYINAMDVALIPFRAGLYMADIALPDKLFEYMACGRTVLSTELPEVRREAGDLVRYYSGEEGLARTVEECFKRSGAGDRERVAWAAQYSWESNARRLEVIFEETIERTSSGGHG